MPEALVLTPLSASLLFLVLVLSGRSFRQNWKAQGDGWTFRAWLYGLPAVVSFLALAFIPMEF